MTLDMLGNLKVINLNLGLLQSPINAGAFCMIAGLIIVPVVSVLTKAPDKALVEDAFSSYTQKVLVKQSSSLGDSEEVK